jgi:hypothetical protein
MSMQPSGELTILAYTVTEAQLIGWLTASPEGAMPRLPDSPAVRLAKLGRLTDATVSEGDSGPVLELEFALDRE